MLKKYFKVECCGLECTTSKVRCPKSEVNRDGVRSTGLVGFIEFIELIASIASVALIASIGNTASHLPQKEKLNT